MWVGEKKMLSRKGGDKLLMKFVNLPFFKKKSSEGIYNFSVKPECTTDPECPDHLACVTEKCQNPCFTSTCGVNAECRAIKHRATCICNPGFVGDPYRICEERKKEILV